jgi:hypothetical protein
VRVSLFAFGNIFVRVLDRHAKDSVGVL